MQSLAGLSKFLTIPVLCLQPVPKFLKMKNDNEDSHNNLTISIGIMITTPRKLGQREDKATNLACALSGLAPEPTLNSQTLLFLQEESKGQLPPTPQLTLGEYFVYFRCSEHFLSSSTALGNMLDFFTNILSCIFDQNVGR